MNASKTYPIVLACGIARFDRILRKDQQDESRHYFRNIKPSLTLAGFHAFHTTVGFAAPLAERARELKTQVCRILDATGAPKVHIIAHSMGGLDTRWMISALSGASQVCSLTTIGAPHLGSPLADLVVSEQGLLKRILERAVREGVDLRGFLALTTDAAKALNRRLEHDELTNNVTYRTWCGECGFWPMFLPLRLGYLILRHYHFEPQNDGLVPASSARWKNDYFAGTVPWDHLNQIGWWTFSRIAGWQLRPARFEKQVQSFYVGIARGLADFQ